MPATDPVSLRRNTGRTPAVQPGPPPAAEQPKATDTNGDHKAADEVYGFLSSFTAGVQKGLDEAHDDPEPGHPPNDQPSNGGDQNGKSQ